MTVFYSDEMGDDWRERIFGWDKFVRRPKYIKVAGSSLYSYVAYTCN